MLFAKFGLDDSRQFYYPSTPPTKACEITETDRSKMLSPKKRTVTTWAPTHIEIGLMAELLTYANIINGLKLNQRIELKPKLDMLCEVIPKLSPLNSGEIISKEIEKGNEQMLAMVYNWLSEGTAQHALGIGCVVKFPIKYQSTRPYAFIRVSYSEPYGSLIN